MSNTPSDAEIEALAKRHGATSYRNRADTQHPAYGFTEDGLNGLIDEVLAKWGTPQQEAQQSLTPETGNSVSAKGAAITPESGTPPARPRHAPGAPPAHLRQSNKPRPERLTERAARLALTKSARGVAALRAAQPSKPPPRQRQGN